MNGKRGKLQQKKSKKVNNHYLNQHKKRQKALEQEKLKIDNTIGGKVESNNFDRENNEKPKEIMPETIVTSMLTSHPSDVTSDSNLELELLRKKLKQTEEELEKIKLIKNLKRFRKKREFSHIDWQVRNIAKQRIFRKVKFITCKQQLDKYQEENSIGNYFFKCYTEHVVNPSAIGNRGEFWSNVKQSIYEAINEKRNAVQTAIKKKWIDEMKI